MLITHHPVLGVGPGRYILALAQQAKVETDRTVGVFKPVHNLPLLAAAEGGILAGLAMVAFLLVLGWRALRTGLPTLAVYLALLPFLMLDHFAYTLPQGLVVLGFWVGFLDGWADADVKGAAPARG
jgi:O-antigen ligase